MTERPFSRDAQRLAKSVFASEPMDSHLYESVRSSMARILLARYRVLGADELLDVVDETIVRLLRHAELTDAPLENPSAWLVTVAMNLARDRIRRLDHEPRLAENLVSDDETARLLDRDASSQAVRQGMAEAIRRGDEIAVKVATVWLDIAGETGDQPGSRIVAARCGYSHTTVNDALARFRDYIVPMPE